MKTKTRHLVSFHNILFFIHDGTRCGNVKIDEAFAVYYGYFHGKKPSYGFCFYKSNYVVVESGITAEESFVYTSLWQYNLERQVIYRRKYFLRVLLLLSGDIEMCPGPSVPELGNLLKVKGLSMFHQNVRGLFSNKPYIEYIMDNHNNIDIITLSETHIAPIDHNIHEIPGYHFYSKERKHGAGGGVGAYISDKIPIQRREDLESPDIELMWLEVKLNNTKSFLVGVIYRPPDSSKFLPINFNKLFSEHLSRVISESKETVILGDVNVNYLNKNANKDFKSILNLFGMKQIITTPTRITNNTSTLIDIVATTHCQHIKTFCTIPSGIADHEMVGCVRKVNHIKYEPKTITCRDYRNYQPDLARNDLNSKD